MTFTTPPLANAVAAPAPNRARSLLVAFGVLVVGVAAYLVILQTMVTTQNTTFFPALLLVGSSTVPLAVLVWATGQGRDQSVDLFTVVLTALAGALIGTVVAGILEYDTKKALSVLPMIFVGVIEESAKLIVPVILLATSAKVRNPRAGIAIGVASGTGFAVLETMGYGFNALLSEKSLAAVDGTLLLRALLSPAGHLAWTGMICAALWHWRFADRSGKGFLLVIVAFVSAVLLHAAWDGSTVLAIHIGVIVISVGVLGYLIHRSHAAQLRPTPAAPGLR